MKTLTYNILRKLSVSERLKAHFLNNFGLGGRTDKEAYLRQLLSEDPALAQEFVILFKLSAHIVVTYGITGEKKSIYSEVKIKKGVVTYYAKYDRHGRMIPDIKDKLL